MDRNIAAAIMQHLVEAPRQLDLSERDAQAFVQALIAPRPVNDRLRDTVRLHHRKKGL